MPDLQHLVQSGSAHVWLYLPAAVLLGALHGLEPGHSKTMMAAFIIAIRGTIAQAALLGLCAALSHSLLIFVLATAALEFGSKWNAETIEPYLQLFSAAAVLLMAAWLFFRTRRDLDAAHHHHHHGHDHTHAHHGPEMIALATPLGEARVSIFEEDTPPVFRVQLDGTTASATMTVTVATIRANGARQQFVFDRRADYWESLDEIPEPHGFRVELAIANAGALHTASGEFIEHEHEAEFQDAHEREHALEIERRFAGRTVTTPQIALFGLTGGLMPCPAAFSVLLVCLQLKRVTLGFAMVAAFSFGLAITMVTTGALAAWSVRHADRKFRGFGELMRRAPYLSCLLLVLVAAYMASHGLRGLHAL